MASEQSMMNEAQERATKVGSEGQTPPEVKVRIFEEGSVDLLRIASLGASDLGRYRANHEYFGQTSLVNLPASLKIVSEAFAGETEGTINTFFGGTALAIEFFRDDPAWQTGRRVVPPGNTAHLYRLQNPDDPAGYALGLQLEVDTVSNGLTAFVIYKSYDATGPAWTNQVFNSDLERIGSADPMAIDTRVQSWSYTVMANAQTGR